MFLLPFAPAWLTPIIEWFVFRRGPVFSCPGAKLVAAGLLLASVGHLAQAQSGASARGAVAPQTHFTAQDVFALRSATDVQLSPDGRRLAYVLAAADEQTDRTQHSIWLLDVATGQQRLLVPAPASTPRWSPDGQRLAYLATESGQAAQLCVQHLATAAVTHLGAGLPGTPDNLTWSPDGRRLACTVFVADTAASAPLYQLPVAKPVTAQWASPLRVITAVHYRSDGGGDLTPGYTHLFVVAAQDPAPPRQLTTGAYNASQAPAWTPDGRYLLFSTNRQPGSERNPNAYDTEIFQVRVADGELTALTQHRGPDQQPVVSPDGQLVAYISSPLYEHGLVNPQLWVMRRDGSQAHALSAGLDRMVDAPRWSPDGRRVYVSYDEAGVTKLGTFDLAGRLQPLTTNLASPEFTVARTGTVAFALTASERPADVAVWRARSGAQRRAAAYTPERGLAPGQTTRAGAAPDRALLL